MCIYIYIYIYYIYIIIYILYIYIYYIYIYILYIYYIYMYCQGFHMIGSNYPHNTLIAILPSGNLTKLLKMAIEIVCFFPVKMMVFHSYCQSLPEGTSIELREYPEAPPPVPAFPASICCSNWVPSSTARILLELSLSHGKLWMKILFHHAKYVDFATSKMMVI